MTPKATKAYAAASVKGAAAAATVIDGENSQKMADVIGHLAETAHILTAIKNDEIFALQMSLSEAEQPYKVAIQQLQAIRDKIKDNLLEYMVAHNVPSIKGRTSRKMNVATSYEVTVTDTKAAHEWLMQNSNAYSGKLGEFIAKEFKGTPDIPGCEYTAKRVLK